MDLNTLLRLVQMYPGSVVIALLAAGWVVWKAAIMWTRLSYMQTAMVSKNDLKIAMADFAEALIEKMDERYSNRDVCEARHNGKSID